MSNMASATNDNIADLSQAPCDAITQMISPREKDLGGFSVRRMLPYAKQRMVGPWIFFDHMGPAHFQPGQGIDVRPHPHINLATVTYLFEGEILHRDSLGSEQPIRPGDINLMVAGRGITHSERSPDALRKQGHTLHGLQLWLALPEDREEAEPAFYHHPGSSLPATEIKGVRLRVMMGQAYGLSSPVRTFSDTLYLEAHMKAGQRLTLPDAPERALYVASGELHTQGTAIPAYHMAILSTQAGIEVQANCDARIALIGGAPIGERHIEWNFVSSRMERIAQAKEDWQADRFPKVPGDEEEYIPLPD